MEANFGIATHGLQLVSRWLVGGAPQLAAMLGCLAQLALGQAAPDSKLTPETRVSIAAKMYALVEVHFGNRKGASDPALDASHQGYLHAVLASEDRREFDLGTMEFLAELHNGHTLFLDSWLNEHYGQPLGFFAAPIEGKWVVQVSFVPGLKPGDVIAAIDGVPMEEFFQRHEKYISASSARARRHNLFLLPYLFPIEFTLRLEDGRSVAINRATAKEQQAKPEARWLKQGDTAHIRIPAFYPPGEDVALDFLRQYQKAKALILDLRNNPGGVPPVRLIRALMDRPYRSWKESVPLRIALFDSLPHEEKPAEASSMSDYARGYHDALANLADNAQITRGGDSVAPAPGAFRGRLVLLVDGGCVSACEDFVMPFKDNGRARLVGETTQGTAGLPYTHDFHNGMVVRIAVKRLSFPDGSEFEGMGIKPDVEVHTSIEMLRQGRDAALAKALELVNQR